MLSLKKSAIPKDLKPQALLLLMIVKEIHDEMELDLTLTSLNDSRHKVDSYHYDGYAFDTRVRTAWRNTANYPNEEQCKQIVKEVQKRAGPCFFALYEHDHIHFQYNARKHG